jgi:type I restriction enzyme M protein
MTDEPNVESDQSLKDGYIEDFISGKAVRATPEETEAVQVFSKVLVDDYGYPKTRLQTRPQWRVKIRPSDTKKEYPIDIGVFGDDNHTEDNILIIVECKKPNRKDGRSQLEDYLRFSKAEVGVWFNGEERLYLRKI